MMNRKTSRRGQVLVEFALVLPLLITLFFGIAEMGFLFFQDHTVNSVCRRAARAAAVGMTDTQVKTFIKAQCVNFGITDAQITVVETDNSQTVVAGNPRTPGDDIRVMVTHNLIFLTPIQRVFQSVGVLTTSSSSAYIIE